MGMCGCPDSLTCFNGGECAYREQCDCSRFNATGARCQTGAERDHICRTWGQYNFETFDGLYYYFSGKSTYALVRHAELDEQSFSIQVNNDPECHSSPYSCKRSISLFFSGEEQIKMSSEVTYKGFGVQLPYVIGNLHIQKLAGYFLVRHQYAFTLAWDGTSAVYIKMAPEYLGKTHGLCGNNNAVLQDDLETSYVITCAEPLTYSECINCCPVSCHQQSQCIGSELHCIDGCYCPDGLIYENDLCVKPTDCPCDYHGSVFQMGSVVYEECNNCTCIGGKWICTNFTCPAECSVSGDTHFMTFDGRKYTFQASCQYILAKSRTSGMFTISLQNAPCGQNQDGSCIQSVSLILKQDPKRQVTLTHSGDVLIYDQYKINLPYADELFEIRKLSSVFLQVKTQIGLQILYDREGLRLYLRVDERWKDDTVGLCGTFNGNTEDDFLYAELKISICQYMVGVTESTPELFGNTWKTSSACVHVQDSSQVDPCDVHLQAGGHWGQILADKCISTQYISAHFPSWIGNECPCYFQGIDYPPGEHVMTSLGKCLVKHGDMCLDADECPCSWKGKEYFPGDKVISSCHTCICQHGSFQCTFQPCPSMCTAYGDRHYRTFDGLTFDFVGTCKVYLVKGTSSTSLSVITENIDCFSTGIICRKNIFINVGKSFLVFDDETGNPSSSSYIDGLQKMQLWKAGFFTVVHFPDEHITILWDQRTTVHVQMGHQWQCVDSSDIRNPCSLKPLREAFAKKECGILLSEAFEACHPVIDVTWFYSNCLADTCGCNQGGDCECFCTSVSAYAHQCCQHGVAVDWRSPRVCPYDCEYFNKALGKGPYKLVSYLDGKLVMAAKLVDGVVYPMKEDDIVPEHVVSFMLTSGLYKPKAHDSSLISFETADRPNYFLQLASNNTLVVSKWKKMEDFHNRSTFVIHKNTWLSGYSSFESFAKPGYFIHISASSVELLKYHHSEEFRLSTLFKLVGVEPADDSPPLLPSLQTSAVPHLTPSASLAVITEEVTAFPVPEAKDTEAALATELQLTATTEKTEILAIPSNKTLPALTLSPNISSQSTEMTSGRSTTAMTGTTKSNLLPEITTAAKYSVETKMVSTALKPAVQSITEAVKLPEAAAQPSLPPSSAAPFSLQTSSGAKLPAQTTRTTVVPPSSTQKTTEHDSQTSGPSLTRQVHVYPAESLTKPPGLPQPVFGTTEATVGLTSLHPLKPSLAEGTHSSVLPTSVGPTKDILPTQKYLHLTDSVTQPLVSRTSVLQPTVPAGTTTDLVFGTKFPPLSPEELASSSLTTIKKEPFPSFSTQKAATDLKLTHQALFTKSLDSKQTLEASPSPDSESTSSVVLLPGTTEIPVGLGPTSGTSGTEETVVEVTPSASTSSSVIPPRTALSPVAHSPTASSASPTISRAGQNFSIAPAASDKAAAAGTEPISTSLAVPTEAKGAMPLDTARSEESESTTGLQSVLTQGVAVTPQTFHPPYFTNTASLLSTVHSPAESKPFSSAAPSSVSATQTSKFEITSEMQTPAVSSLLMVSDHPNDTAAPSVSSFTSSSTKPLHGLTTTFSDGLAVAESMAGAAASPFMLPQETATLQTCTPITESECIKHICLDGQLIQVNKSQNCPYNATQPTCGVLGFATQTNGDKCCPKWECACRCTIFSDLSIVTYDGNNLALFKEASYIVSQTPDETITIHVLDCRMITVNSRSAWPTVRKYGYKVEDSGFKYAIETPTKTRIQWFHNTGVMIIELNRTREPGALGLCGFCDRSLENDLMLPNRTVLSQSSSPSTFIDSWQVPDTLKYVGEDRHQETNCSVMDCSECLRMVLNQTFSSCHPYIPPEQFCDIWARDTEYIRNPCVSLAAYVAMCNKFNICIDWRSSDYCPCTDSSGTPRAVGEIWSTSLDGCCMQKCVDSETIIPVEHNCSEIHDLECQRFAEVALLVPGDQTCCPQKICKCACETIPKPQCKLGQKLQIDEVFQNSTENVCNCVKYKCGKEDGKFCKKVTVRMTIRKNDCRSNTPVNIVSCDGKCPSASIYNYNINTYARFCKCCRELGLQRRTVQLYCTSNSTWVTYSIQEPTDCSCQWS
ncbi:hypothetical protein TURU_063946 [Turdus rufiventris]|nr:hypothetical protein TURU_063946 [Turdus rufiventris]